MRARARWLIVSGSPGSHDPLVTRPRDSEPRISFDQVAGTPEDVKWSSSLEGRYIEGDRRRWPMLHESSEGGAFPQEGTRHVHRQSRAPGRTAAEYPFTKAITIALVACHWQDNPGHRVMGVLRRACRRNRSPTPRGIRSLRCAARANPTAGDGRASHVQDNGFLLGRNGPGERTIAPGRAWRPPHGGMRAGELLTKWADHPGARQPAGHAHASIPEWLLLRTAHDPDPEIAGPSRSPDPWPAGRRSRQGHCPRRYSSVAPRPRTRSRTGTAFSGSAGPGPGSRTAPGTHHASRYPRRSVFDEPGRRRRGQILVRDPGRGAGPSREVADGAGVDAHRPRRRPPCPHSSCLLPVVCPDDRGHAAVHRQDHARDPRCAVRDQELDRGCQVLRCPEASEGVRVVASCLNVSLVAASTRASG